MALELALGWALGHAAKSRVIDQHQYICGKSTLFMQLLICYDLALSFGRFRIGYFAVSALLGVTTWLSHCLSQCDKDTTRTRCSVKRTVPILNHFWGCDVP